MRRIAVINQKGGVGKTTTALNLGAALVEKGRRVVIIDMDPQANLGLSLGIEVPSGEPSTYTVLHGETSLSEAIRPTSTPGLSVVPSNIDLSGAEMELASAIGRENIMRDALELWEREGRTAADAEGRPAEPPAHYVIFDCPPSLGLLSINALAAAQEVLVTLQTEFLALQGISKLVEIVDLLKRRMNPELAITGIVATLYDSRLKLAREVLGEIRRYFPEETLSRPIRMNVKLAEAPSFGQTIFEYAPDSKGAIDYRLVALEYMQRESLDPDFAPFAPARPAQEAEAPAEPAPPASSATGASPATPVPTAPSAAPEETTQTTALEELPDETEDLRVVSLTPRPAPGEETPQVSPDQVPGDIPGAPEAEQDPAPGL